MAQRTKKREQARDTAGADASSPTDIPARGWRAVARRVQVELKEDHVSLLAAGVAFKALLALFPALVAAISIFGLVADPQQLQQQLQNWLSALPDDAGSLIEGQLTDVATTGAGALSGALAVSILLALWSASGGVAGLIEGCNAAYDEVDRRSFPVKRGVALLMTLGAMVFVLLAIGLIAVLPALLDRTGLGSAAQLAIRIAQWPLLALLVIVALAVMYRFGPDREHPSTRWATPGALIATVLWLIGSAVFTIYVERFGDFGATYGALAGVIILMLWLFLTSFVVLLGAEINAELERQTAVDTTTGDAVPLGERGAYVADTTPASFESEELDR